MKWSVLLLSSFSVLSVVSLPVKNNGSQDGDKVKADVEEYKRYLGEMARSDPNFMDKLRKIKDFDMDKLKDLLAKNPHLQERLSWRGAGGKNEAVRSKLDEERRLSIEQMRQLQRLQSMKDNNLINDGGDWLTRKEVAKEKLSPDFTNQQIQAKLAEAQHHMQNLDQQRKEEFKREEMWLEHRRRQKLAEMNEQQRLKTEAEFEKKQAELRKHERVPHPASKEQLEKVWEEKDGMSKSDFDPKTFFHMHDTNGDMVLDAMELEALFYNELKKVYKDQMGGIEAQEDLARMREHALSEMDKDGNGMISLAEFMKYTGDKLFDNQEEWQPMVDKDPPFSSKEFDDYEENYEDDYDYQYDEDGNVIGILPKKANENHRQPGNEQGQPPQAGNEQREHPDNERGQPPQPGKEQGQPPQPGNKQGQPSQPGNEQGQPPQPGNEQGQPPHPGNEHRQASQPGNERGRPLAAVEGVRDGPGMEPVLQVEDPQMMGEAGQGHRAIRNVAAGEDKKNVGQLPSGEPAVPVSDH